MKTKEINLVIIGFGVIGKGFAEVLADKHDFLRANYGVDLKVTAICERDGSVVCKKGIDLDNVVELSLNNNLKAHENWTTLKSLDVINKIRSDIVLELTPSNIETGQPGLTHIKESLKRGMCVVTSNKAPLAVEFSQLQKLAKNSGAELRYEATVGGALPLINLRKHALQVNNINSIQGILNGTCNYVLTKMADEYVSMDVALKEAQNLGIAEADPSYDINGIDTGAKVVILANSLLGMDVSFKDVAVTGISDVTTEAIELARKHNHVIKLIGDVERLDVSPRLVPINHPLNVSGTLNAVTISTDIARDITVIGPGAGGKETSSSLFSDIIDIIRSK